MSTRLCFAWKFQMNRVVLGEKLCFFQTMASLVDLNKERCSKKTVISHHAGFESDHDFLIKNLLFGRNFNNVMFFLSFNQFYSHALRYKRIFHVTFNCFDFLFESALELIDSRSVYIMFILALIL